MSRPVKIDPTLGFKSLHMLLHEYAPAVIARAIKQNGIFTWDEYGDFVKAEDDGKDWSFQVFDNNRYKMRHKHDETSASRHTQSFALAIVSLVYATYQGKLKRPSTHIVNIKGLHNFGWSKDTLPNFEAIKQGAVTQTKETAGEAAQKASPETQFSNERGGVDPLSIFREMKSLAAEDIRLVFLSDNYMEVSTKDTRRQVHLGEMLLFDRKIKRLNARGLLLQNMAQRKKIERTDINGKHISDIRILIFQGLLRITDNPFHPKQQHWAPYFSVDIQKNRSDEREKKRVKRVEFDGNNKDHGAEAPFKDDDGEEYPYESENDLTDKLMDDLATGKITADECDQLYKEGLEAKTSRNI